MWRLIAITCIALYLIRKILRLLTPPMVEQSDAVELKACAYCETLVRVDKAITLRGYFFCCTEHAQQFLNKEDTPRV